MIRFETVSLAYNADPLFSGLSFEVSPGAKAVLVGPSGGGKTSALELIPGLRRPNSGTISVDGRPVGPATRQDIRAGLAYLPQTTPLIGAVRPALHEFLRSVDRATSSRAEAGIVALITRLGLHASILDSRFEDLSGGESRRVGLAAVLSLQRPLLLLDEPTAGLDPRAARAVQELVFDLPATVLSIDHDPAWQSACDQVVTIGTAVTA